MEIYFSILLRILIQFKAFFMKFANIMAISPREAFKLCQEGAVILDIRPDAISLYKGFDVPEVLYCIKEELSSYIQELPSNRIIIIADSTGVYSKNVCSMLMDHGIENVIELAGGFVEWERDQLPITTDNKARLSGSCMCQLKYRSRQ